MKAKSRVAATAVSLGLMLFSFNHCVLDQKVNTKKPSTTNTTESTSGDPVSDNTGNTGNQTPVIPTPIVEVTPTPAPGPDPVMPPPAVIQAQEIDVGVKNFEQINASMSVLTGVSEMNNSVRNTYNDLEVQLPSRNNVKSFLAANQVAITKLAAEYCDALVNSGTLRQGVWPGFDFGAAPNQSLANSVQKTNLIEQTLNRFWGTNVGGDRSVALIEMRSLLDELLAGENQNATTTQTTVKGLCTAALASAQVTLI